MSQLKKGALLSYLTIFLTNIIGLVLTPFIIRSLGDAEYGLYILIGAFVGYISLMDLGLNNTIVRFVAKYRAENDKKGEENFLATTMLIYLFISLIVVVFGTGLYFNIENIFGNSLNIEEMEKAKIMFIILIFNVAITLPGGAFRAICNGYERFVFPRAINIVRYIIRSILVVVILLYGSDAVGLVILDTCMNILIIIITGVYVIKKLNVKFRLHQWNSLLIKDIFSYSIWIFVMAIVLEFQWKSGQIVLGIKQDTVSVAIYAVGILLGGYYGAFANAINGLILPRAMQMVVANSSGKVITDEMIKIGRITFFVLLLILGGFILFGKEFVNLWVGEKYSSSWLIALIIMLVSTNILVQSYANQILKAKKLFRFKGLTYILFTTLGVMLGYYLTDQWGGVGMIIGISSGWFISQMILNFYFCRKLNIEIGRFYKLLFKNTFLVFSILLIVGYLGNSLFETYNWITLFFKILFFSLLYCTLIYLFAMNKYERQLTHNLLKMN
jgi:O-antigen/teichoic acid export membrane protein